MRTVEELTELFRSTGRKVTPQRQCIFRALEGAAHHPTAEAVYAVVSAEMPTISLRTVYQTLNDLSSMGELVALDLGTGATRFDPNLVPHHHLVCEACGRIEDLHAEFPGVALPAEDPCGFEVSATEITFRGRCATCAAAGPAATVRPTHQRQDPQHQQQGGASAHG